MVYKKYFIFSVCVGGVKAIINSEINLAWLISKCATNWNLEVYIRFWSRCHIYSIIPSLSPPPEWNFPSAPCGSPHQTPHLNWPSTIINSTAEECGSISSGSLSNAYGAQGRPNGTCVFFMNGSFFIPSHVTNDAVTWERNSRGHIWSYFRSGWARVGVFEHIVIKMTGPPVLHTHAQFVYHLES